MRSSTLANQALSVTGLKLVEIAEGHARIKLCVTQSIIKSAIESMADSVEMEYAPGTMKLRFNDGNYQAVIALRREK